MKPPLSIQITALGSYSPARVVTNDELSHRVDTSDEWIKSHTGIAVRHLAAELETTADLATKAVENLLANHGRTAAEIDGIVVATATPDYPGFPSTACLLAQRFGIKGPALDISAGCTGFIYALEVGRAICVSAGSHGAHRVLGRHGRVQRVGRADTVLRTDSQLCLAVADADDGWERA